MRFQFSLQKLQYSAECVYSIFIHWPFTLADVSSAGRFLINLCVSILALPVLKKRTVAFRAFIKGNALSFISSFCQIICHRSIPVFQLVHSLTLSLCRMLTSIPLQYYLCDDNLISLTNMGYLSPNAVLVFLQFSTIENTNDEYCQMRSKQQRYRNGKKEKQNITESHLIELSSEAIKLMQCHTFIVWRICVIHQDQSWHPKWKVREQVVVTFLNLCIAR